MTWPPPLHLAPLHSTGPEPALLRRLSRRLKKLLRTRVSVVSPIDIPLSDTADQPLSSNLLVDALLDREPADVDPFSRWTVLITDRDLATPNRAFVFGEATLGGAWAVVSTARLATADDSIDTLVDRLLKEVVHEIGHLAGLPHCRRSHCVMHPSTSPLEVDRKDADFCDRCRPLFFRSDPLDRYHHES